MSIEEFYNNSLTGNDFYIIEEVEILSIDEIIAVEKTKSIFDTESSSMEFELVPMD
jgi:hypothetical protein